MNTYNIQWGGYGFNPSPKIKVCVCVELLLLIILSGILQPPEIKSYICHCTHTTSINDR